VQVVGRLVARRRTAPDSAPIAFAGELPGLIYPGDRFVVDLTATAVDDRLRPLTPGEYDLQIELAQLGFGAFDRSAANRLHVSVTVAD
jgi:hypothetical protein